MADLKQGPVLAHRRLLQARRTRKFRDRQKVTAAGTTTSHQPTLLYDAIESAAEERQAARGKSPVPQNGEFDQGDISAGDPFIISGEEDDDPSISNIGPYSYYDEDPVPPQSIEEDIDKTRFQSPDIRAEEQANLPGDGACADVQYATQKFLHQFLVGIYGCNAQSHQESLAAHIKTE